MNDLLMSDFIFTIHLVQTQCIASLFRPQTFHRISHRRFYCLEAYGY